MLVRPATSPRSSAARRGRPARRAPGGSQLGPMRRCPAAAIGRRGRRSRGLAPIDSAATCAERPRPVSSGVRRSRSCSASGAQRQGLVVGEHQAIASSRPQWPAAEQVDDGDAGLGEQGLSRSGRGRPTLITAVQPLARATRRPRASAPDFSAKRGVAVAPMVVARRGRSCRGRGRTSTIGRARLHPRTDRLQRLELGAVVGRRSRRAEPCRCAASNGPSGASWIVARRGQRTPAGTARGVFAWASISADGGRRRRSASRAASPPGPRSPAAPPCAQRPAPRRPRPLPRRSPAVGHALHDLVARHDCRGPWHSAPRSRDRRNAAASSGQLERFQARQPHGRGPLGDLARGAGPAPPRRRAGCGRAWCRSSRPGC